METIQIKTKRPVGVKWIIALTYLKFALSIFLIIAACAALFGNPESPAVSGIRNSFIKRGLFEETGDNAEALGYVIGSVILTIIYGILQIIGAYVRNLWIIVIPAGLEILGGLGGGGFPLAAIAIFVICLVNPNRDYLLNKKNGSVSNDVQN